METIHKRKSPAEQQIVHPRTKCASEELLDYTVYLQDGKEETTSNKSQSCSAENVDRPSTPRQTKKFKGEKLPCSKSRSTDTADAMAEEIAGIELADSRISMVFNGAYSAGVFLKERKDIHWRDSARENVKRSRREKAGRLLAKRRHMQMRDVQRRQIEVTINYYAEDKNDEPRASFSNETVQGEEENRLFETVDPDIFSLIWNCKKLSITAEDKYTKNRKRVAPPIDRVNHYYTPEPKRLKDNDVP